MKLNLIFNDGVIFQANKPIRIFGTGNGEITVSFCGNEKKFTVTDTEWLIELPAMDYGGPYEMHLNLAGEEKTVKDIYIGDVYLLAGQSNMALKLGSTDCSRDLYNDDSLFRLFLSEQWEGLEKIYPNGGWISANKESAEYWSAIGYMAGTVLREKTGHAVGLITSYCGAADIQTYLPEYVFERPEFNIPEYERRDSHFAWNKEHSILYNSQTKNLIPFSVAAVIWYQGESNTSKKESAIYGEMLSELIDSWRKEFMDTKLPFAVVQIADYDSFENPYYWHQVQKAQEEIQFKKHNVKTVVSRDVCESSDIHPTKKFALSQRIAQAVYDLIQ